MQSSIQVKARISVLRVCAPNTKKRVLTLGYGYVSALRFLNIRIAPGVKRAQARLLTSVKLGERRRGGE